MSTRARLGRSAGSRRTPSGTNIRRESVEVSKLVDIDLCIGCKACEVACKEWNDLRPSDTFNFGSYQSHEDLTATTWDLMRFKEVDLDNGDLAWLIRKDSCMHCDEPGCLLACPAPGAIVQYENGIVDFDQTKCIGCQYCVSGCPFDIPRFDQTTQEGLQVHDVRRPGGRGPRAGVREGVPHGVDPLRLDARRCWRTARPRSPSCRIAASTTPCLRPVGGERAAHDVRGAPRRHARRLRAAEGPRGHGRRSASSAVRRRCGRAWPSGRG